MPLLGGFKVAQIPQDSAISFRQAVPSLCFPPRDQSCPPGRACGASNRPAGGASALQEVAAPGPGEVAGWGVPQDAPGPAP